jgi:hypothetical protein
MYRSFGFSRFIGGHMLAILLYLAKIRGIKILDMLAGLD